MFLVWKNKGLLVLLYLIVSFMGSIIIVGVLHRNIGGLFSKIDFYTTIGIAFLITGIWTYLTKDDFYKDREGNKKKMDTKNEFFFLSMKTWSIIFFALAVLFVGNLIFGYFPPAK